MPVPSRYKEIAIRIAPLQKKFFIMAAVGLILSVLSIFISIEFRLNLLIFHGLGFLMFLWGWGLFLIVSWYGKKSKMAARFSESVVSFLEWFASIFLNIWLIFGSIGIIFFTFS
ncbi:MAG: hypothetical protein GY699_03645 [Desulfobacteraceae bacterium]|nr:hypothetical protein [Desulfobacteraceae bacterium]